MGINYEHLILCSIASGLISFTLIEAEVAAPLRSLVSKLATRYKPLRWLEKLFSCVYCTCHWVTLASFVVVPGGPLNSAPVSGGILLWGVQYLTCTAFALAVVASLSRAFLGDGYFPEEDDNE